MTDEPRPSPMPVPPLLRDLAGWTWRLLLLAGAGYLFVQLLDTLYFLVLPFIGALLATALANPATRWLRHKGLPRAAATWITVIVGALVFGAMFFYVVNRAIDQYPQLVDQVQNAVDKGRHFLVHTLHVKPASLNNIDQKITTFLSKHRSALESTAVTTAGIIGEAIAAFVLWFFITFFLLYDGDRIWAWIVGLFPAGGRERVQTAGMRAWARLAGFVRGTFIIALFHGIVVAITLAIMGVPLVAPLALLVFMGSFLPIIGAFLFGGLAVAVTLVTQGGIDALILIGVLVIDNQIEAHVFQPFLVGRYVRLHPLAVAIAIAGGGLLEGIFGAVLAVPFVAVVYAVTHYLATGNGDDAAPEGDKPTPPGEDDDAPTAEERLVPEGEPA